MNKRKIECLRKALDEIMAMDRETLFRNFGNPEHEYFFSELGKAEKLLFPEMDDFSVSTKNRRITYRNAQHFETELKPEDNTQMEQIEYLCAA